MSENIQASFPIIESILASVDSPKDTIDHLNETLSQCVEADDRSSILTHLSTSKNPLIKDAATTLLNEMNTQNNAQKHLI